ncbi:MAG: site-specific integrase [Clostridiales bacterium]|nr:site-specific integrase [Clostridiales bacterium]
MKNDVRKVEKLSTEMRVNDLLYIYLQVLFAVLMGLRRSEINGLKYSDIDFVRQKLHISRRLGRAANCDETDFEPKTKTKQEIKLKTQSSDRVLDIPDFVFEEILKAREQYEKNRSRRSKSFQDLNYICCSSYGRPRSMQYHFKPFKEILKNDGLPDIRWHDLRHSYATLLLKNEFNLKAISKILGHAKEIVTEDIYINNQEIIADGIGELKDYMEEVIPEKSREFNEKEKVFDYSGLDVTSAFDNLIT